jgi:hypothetical protein
MKQLVIIIAVILLAACSKPTPPVQTNILYYRIQQIDLDGTKTCTPVRRIKVDLAANATSDEDEEDEEDQEDDDGDDDDDDDEDEEEEEDDECDDDYTLAINFTTFTVRNVKNGIQINWEADDEQNVSHYIIERSIDTKNWVGRLNYIPDLSGKYAITDTYE